MMRDVSGLATSRINVALDLLPQLDVMPRNVKAV